MCHYVSTKLLIRDFTPTCVILSLFLSLSLSLSGSPSTGSPLLTPFLYPLCLLWPIHSSSPVGQPSRLNPSFNERKSSSHPGRTLVRVFVSHEKYENMCFLWPIHPPSPVGQPPRLTPSSMRPPFSPHLFNNTYIHPVHPVHPCTFPLNPSPSLCPLCPTTLPLM